MIKQVSKFYIKTESDPTFAWLSLTCFILVLVLPKMNTQQESTTTPRMRHQRRSGVTEVQDKKALSHRTWGQRGDTAAAEIPCEAKGERNIEFTSLFILVFLYHLMGNLNNNFGQPKRRLIPSSCLPVSRHHLPLAKLSCNSADMGLWEPWSAGGGQRMDMRPNKPTVAQVPPLVLLHQRAQKSEDRVSLGLISGNHEGKWAYVFDTAIKTMKDAGDWQKILRFFVTSMSFPMWLFIL